LARSASTTTLKGVTMRTFLIVFAVIMFSPNTNSQELRLFGPRAGFGILPEDTKAKLKSGIHSAFGWQIEVPYASKEITGYGEGGLMLLGIEQGVVFPYLWGFFGIRTKIVGFGVGPVVNPIGIGLGINPYFQIDLEKTRIPIGLTMDFIQGTTRFQFSVGFMYK
jgi:hypothetical protein